MWYLVMALLLCAGPVYAGPRGTFQVPQIPFAPRVYACPKVSQPVRIDGKLDDPAWKAAPWTEDFVDIVGPSAPTPRYRTRAKMLWDDDFFYVAAELEEPNVWAKLTQRDTIIFHDNDFEVFIDPDGDTQQYYELELNAQNTVWDLLLIKAYRDGGPPVTGWDIHGLKTAVHVDGTLNVPGDTDRGWTVEIAFPWKALRECTVREVPPEPGDRWRVNFSRVEWRTRVENGRIVKLRDPKTGRPMPEDNWVWSPQGLVNMHYPEMWGIVEFREAGTPGSPPAKLTMEERAQWLLRLVYYGERRQELQTGRFIVELNKLDVRLPQVPGCNGRPAVQVTQSGFEATLPCPGQGKIWHIREDGRVWATPLESAGRQR